MLIVVPLWLIRITKSYKIYATPNEDEIFSDMRILSYCTHVKCSTMAHHPTHGEDATHPNTNIYYNPCILYIFVWYM